MTRSLALFGTALLAAGLAARYGLAQSTRPEAKKGLPPLSALTAPARINPAVVLNDDPDWTYANTEIYRDRRNLDIIESRLAATGLGRFVLSRGVGNAPSGWRSRSTTDPTRTTR